MASVAALGRGVQPRGERARVVSSHVLFEELRAHLSPVRQSVVTCRSSGASLLAEQTPRQSL